MTDGLIIQEMKNRPGQNNRVIHDNRKDNKKMKELYEAIEAKLKQAVIREQSPEKMYTMTSVTRLMEKRMEVMYCYPSSKMM